MKPKKELEEHSLAKKSAQSSEDTKKVDETKCNVCNEGDYADNDLIVFCAVRKKFTLIYHLMGYL